MILRSYQQRAIAELRQTYAGGRRAPCLVLPTGAGKTVVAAEIIRAATALKRRVLFLAHRRELIDQSRDKLENAGITRLRVIRASEDSGCAADTVTVASVPTLAMARWRDRMPVADLVIFDECHHVKAETWSRIAHYYGESHLLGLTATPQRSDGAALGDIFDSLVVGATVRELTDLGHLVPCRVWAPAQQLERQQVALSPLEAYRQFGNGERAVIFCGSVEHATSIAVEMTQAGVATEVVHGQLPAATRADVLKQFRTGALRAIANVHVLTEGWDDPGCSVCILTRKPQHAGTYLQMAGRVLRPAPGKASAMLVDLCGSALVHGTPDMDRTFTLDGKGISKTHREAIRQCPTCGGVFTQQASMCPVCGAELPRVQRSEPRNVGVGVVEVTAADQQKLQSETLRRNLEAAARRSKRSCEWVERAHAAIAAASFRYVP